MRIALHHSGEVGVRTGRILLGDRRVTKIGLVYRDPNGTPNDRVERVSDWASYDVVVTDAEEPGPVIAKALDSATDCVVWVEAQGTPSAADGGAVLLVGSNLATGIAPCLTSHEVAMADLVESDTVESVTIAWTEPGDPLRTGEPLAFPDPVGGRWGKKLQRDTGSYVAPLQGEWAAAMAKVGLLHSDKRLTRIVGVADLAPHLEALALAAGALAVGAGAYGPGARSPADSAEAYLAEALRAGLDVASYSIET